MPAWQAGNAQVGTTATVAGTVTDPSGAVVTGATVTVKSRETSIERKTITLDNGNYVVTELQPGTYSLILERAGFKRSEQKNITLVIGQRATINVQLQVGSEHEQVTVTASDVPVIQTEDSSIGAVIESKTIVNTPLNGRLSIMGLMALAPGVQNAGSQDQIPVYGITPSVGTGSRSSYGGIGYTLDGAPNLLIPLQRGAGEVPPLDGIEEFKFLTSDVPAQYGQPAQVVVVSKRGGNQYHGMLVEFNRVAAMAAKEYTNNTAWGYSGGMPKYIRNEYGANFSGPLTIPHLYNGKDRSFFFFNWENFELRQADQLVSTGPTDLMRKGIFTEFADATTSFTPHIIDPSNGNDYGTDISAHMNPTSVKLMNLLYPETTIKNTITNNTWENVPYVSTVKRFAFRVDHKISDKDSLRFTYLRALYGPNPSTGNSSLQGGLSGIGEHVNNHIIGWTHIFSPTLISDVTASYFHMVIYRIPQNVNTDFASIINGLGEELMEGAPTISIKNMTSVGEAGSKGLTQDVSLSTSITKILARHTLKAGFNYIYDNYWALGVTSPQRGGYSFDGTYNLVGKGSLTTGFADFLLGYPYGGSYATQKTSPNTFIARPIDAQYGLFVQDDWKITPKLTINMGVRYDVQRFRRSPYGNAALFIPSLGKVVLFANSFNSPSSVTPIPQAVVNSYPIVLAPTVGMSTNEWDYLGTDGNNFAPRLGFAYAVQPKMVVRGAFGVYFNLLPPSYVDNIAPSNFPYQAQMTYTQPTWTGSYVAANAPTISMSNPFGVTGAFAANPSITAEHPMVTPYTEQYNLAVEREVSRGLAVRVGYVGQHNVKQNNYGGSGNTSPDINYPTTITNAAIQARRVYQPWSSISLGIDPLFHSTMNSLQVGAHKLYSSGLMLNAEYSWSRILGTENFMNPQTVGDSYGNIGGIAPQVLVVNYSYPLPLGHGKALLGNAGNVLNKAVSGWQVSGITTFKSGTPFSVSYSCSGTGCVSGRADRDPNMSALYPSKKTIQQWFNKSAFAAPNNPLYNTVAKPKGGDGYVYGNSAYNMLRGPYYQNWDMNLQKTTIFRDRINLQLRMDAFNFVNHASFSNPNASYTSSAIGKITSTSNYSRKVEFGAKLTF